MPYRINDIDPNTGLKYEQIKKDYCNASTNDYWTCAIGTGDKGTFFYENYNVHDLKKEYNKLEYLFIYVESIDNYLVIGETTDDYKVYFVFDKKAHKTIKSVKCNSFFELGSLENSIFFLDGKIYNYNGDIYDKIDAGENEILVFVYNESSNPKKEKYKALLYNWETRKQREEKTEYNL